MKLQIRNRCSDFSSYRAARVKSLFNAETGCNFDLDADIPCEQIEDWRVGVVVGPSGSGKTSVGRKFFNGENFWEYGENWPGDAPIIDCIAPDGDFDAVTGALSAVGLGNVPSWLRPYHVLSNGEKFRAELARIITEAPQQVVIDEFTSVVDRQIAKFGALAFQKAWRRTGGQAVILSCHYDILDWLEPDWVFDTATGKFSGRGLHRRPRFELEIWETDWRYWPLFEPHHYLKLPRMVAATCYVGTVDGELVSHMAVGTRAGRERGVIGEARACRLVVMPEWQGAGVGTRFLNGVCEMWLQGKNRYGLKLKTCFHTSHPGLASALRRMPQWRQLSAMTHGANKKRSGRSIRKSAILGGRKMSSSGGYGGHFRAVQGFRYYGEAGVQALKEKRA